MTKKTLLAFGYGYSAIALGSRLKKEGWRVIGTTRSAEKAASMAREGVEAHLFPGDDLTDALGQASHVLTSIGPGASGDPVMEHLGDAITARAARLDWFGYLSTTGVYGDHGGAWVDETTPTRPTTQRCIWRKSAEESWAAIPDLPLHIFRLAGIYGPGRGPFAKLRSGTARRIIKPGQVFSRIHVDDIAQALAASIAAPSPGAVYNLCDDEPAPPQDVIAHAASLLDHPVPPDLPIGQAELSPMARSFYSENKRVRNDRMKRELGVRLIHPDYRSGLAADLAFEKAKRHE